MSLNLRLSLHRIFYCTAFHFPKIFQNVEAAFVCTRKCPTNFFTEQRETREKTLSVSNGALSFMYCWSFSSVGRHPLIAQLSLCTHILPPLTPCPCTASLCESFSSVETNLFPYKQKSPKACGWLSLPFQHHSQFLSSAGKILKRQADSVSFHFQHFIPLFILPRCFQKVS